MNENYIDRYIYAVTRRLKKEVRDDVSTELKGLIEDMLLERCEEKEASKDDIQAVLEQLGMPEELYQKYDTNLQKCLIGAPHYTLYQHVLKIVLICTVFGMVLASIVTQITTPMTFGETVLDLFGNLWGGLLMGFAIVTLIFAFLFQKDIKIEHPFSLNELPEIPEKRQMISRKGTYFGIGISVIFLVVFLAAPQIFCVMLTAEKKFIPIFQVETIRQTWYFIVIFFLLGMTREIIKALEGRFNQKVMVVSVITDLLSGVISVLWLTNSRIINPEFSESVTILFQGEKSFIIDLFQHFQYFFLGLILFALLLDMITAVVKSR